MLEIIHDLAPGARLSFANIDTDLSFVQAVNYLASTNDIVVDDLGFFGDAFDGTSVVSAGTATALNNPAYPIRAYFTAVGNSADEHYYGVYQDSGVEATSLGGGWRHRPPASVSAERQHHRCPRARSATVQPDRAAERR